MRVFHVVPALFGANGGVTGGAERYVLELARHMAELVPTTLVSFGPQDESRTLGRLSIRLFGGAHAVRGLASNPFSLRALAFLRHADVVHCHQRRIVMSSLSALLCRATGRRVFVTDLGGGGWDISAYISTRSWFQGDLHISEYSRRVAGQENDPRAHIIMGGVDADRFSPDPGARRDNTIVYVGRILPHKGIDTVIRALPPHLRLRILGQPYHPAYLALLRELAAGKDVTFEHDATDEDLVRAYRGALCVVLASVYKDVYGGESRVPELLGQTLLEGMACGTPAVCTDVASMPEVVEHGVTGFVVPPYEPDALRARFEWLAGHPEAVETMGRAGRERVLARFTWPAVASRCVEIYRSCQ